MNPAWSKMHFLLVKCGPKKIQLQLCELTFAGRSSLNSPRKLLEIWLVVSTPLKNISQIGSFPQIGAKIKNVWNHQLEMIPTWGLIKNLPVSSIPKVKIGTTKQKKNTGHPPLTKTLCLKKIQVTDAKAFMTPSTALLMDLHLPGVSRRGGSDEMEAWMSQEVTLCPIKTIFWGDFICPFICPKIGSGRLTDA